MFHPCCSIYQYFFIFIAAQFSIVWIDHIWSCIHQIKDISVVYIFLLLFDYWCGHPCSSLCIAYVFSFGGYIVGVELLGNMFKLITGYLYVKLFEELSKCFPQRLHNYTFLLVVYECSNFSISSPILFSPKYSHFSGCEVVSHSCFDLCFPHDQRYLVSFSYAYWSFVFCLKNVTEIFCPL